MRLASLSFVLLLVACQATPPIEAPNKNTADDLVVTWEVTPEADGPYGTPRHSLSVVLSGVMEDRILLGTYAGTFSDGREIPGFNAPDAFMSGGFWRGGTGDQFKLTVEDRQLMVEHRVIDEGTRDTEYTVLQKKYLPPEVADIYAGPWEVE